MKLAIFDFDRTLFPKDTIPYLMKQWYKLDYPKSKITRVYMKLLPAYIVYKLRIGGTKSKERLRHIAVDGFRELFKGMTKEEIEGFFHRVGKILKNELNGNVVSKVRDAKDKGMHTVIISGAYNPLLNIIGEHLKIDTIIGTELIYFDNEIYNHNEELVIIEGDKKAEEIVKRFNEEIDWENSWFYTDSIRDLKLLELVGNPIVVNPDPELLAHATKLKWTIIA